jgi:hypothetical protein
MAKGAKAQRAELDSIYFLKLLVYLIFGFVWISLNGHRVIPIGLIAGILMAQHEKLRLDRKVEYAVLLISSILGLIGFGLTLTVNY